MFQVRRTAAHAIGFWLVAAVAFAHGAGAVHAEAGWTLAPWLLTSMAVSAGLFVVGWLNLTRRTRAGRPTLWRSAVLFGSGWTVLFIAAISPLHEAGERSFALHMLEHELLMLVAAPLLVLARPAGPLLWGLPRSFRAIFKAGGKTLLRPVLGFWTTPMPATLLQIAVLWIWHMPALFDLALAHEGWHIAQHLSFLISALLFWQAMLRPGRSSLLLRVGCLFLTSAVAGALGALMAFAAGPWYERYAQLGMAPFGLSAAEDQQLAGLLMWIPGGLVHVAAALLLMSQIVTKREPSDCSAGGPTPRAWPEKERST